ncbi:MAG: methyltransferase domain-containing protein [Candidatus ainarchaeum sp.]|nr:methyltransferase domain-containing protein [Candidatus ainarchaeum sp.]
MKKKIFTDEEGRMYEKTSKGMEKLAVFSDHYYSLRVFNGIPILEIDGVRMHLVKNFETPLEYAKRVCKLLRINKEDVVLDSCGGLGYTAIEASKKAKKIISIEKSPEVIELAKKNPYSKKYFENKNIIRINGNSFEKIKEFEDNRFTKIIHDPPRINFSEELYSPEFYKEILRVLKKGGVFYHYIGFVGKGRGKNISEEIAGKIGKINGFKTIKYDEKCYAWLFIKTI